MAISIFISNHSPIVKPLILVVLLSFVSSLHAECVDAMCGGKGVCLAGNSTCTCYTGYYAGSAMIQSDGHALFFLGFAFVVGALIVIVLPAISHFKSCNDSSSVHGLPARTVIACITIACCILQVCFYGISDSAIENRETMVKYLLWFIWSSIFSWWVPFLRWRQTSPEQLQALEERILKASGIKFKQIVVEVNNHKINTLITGNGPPLVMLHGNSYTQSFRLLIDDTHSGFGGGLALWISNYGELSKHHTIYAMDLPGFGRSSRTVFKGKTIYEAEEYFLSTIEAWRKELNLNTFDLLGHSFGGYLAGVYSLKHPEQIKHVILADPWGIPVRSIEWERAMIPLRWRMVRSLANSFGPLFPIRAAGPLGPTLVTRFRKDIEEKFSHMMEDTSAISQYIYHSNVQDPAGENAFARLNQALTWAKNPLINRLTELDPSIHLTMFYGSQSWMDKDAGRALQNKLGDRAQLFVISHSGHHIYIDNHQEFNQKVIDVVQLAYPYQRA